MVTKKLMDKYVTLVVYKNGVKRKSGKSVRKKT